MTSIAICGRGQMMNPTYISELKRDPDSITDDDRFVLNSGSWMRFNHDYFDFLDEYPLQIQVEPTERDLLET